MFFIHSPCCGWFTSPSLLFVVFHSLSLLWLVHFTLPDFLLCFTHSPCCGWFTSPSLLFWCVSLTPLAVDGSLPLRCFFVVFHSLSLLWLVHFTLPAFFCRVSLTLLAVACSLSSPYFFVVFHPLPLLWNPQCGWFTSLSLLFVVFYPLPVLWLVHFISPALMLLCFTKRESLRILPVSPRADLENINS